MKKTHTHIIRPELIQIGTIVFSGIGIGILSTSYSSLFAVIGAALFAMLSIALYMSLHSQSMRVAVVPVSSSETKTKNSVLFYLFYLSFFLSITIPKSGKTVSGVPITTANVFILLALILWTFKFVFLPKSLAPVPAFKPVILFILYGVVVFFIGLINRNPRKFVILDFVALVGFIPVYFLVCGILTTQKRCRKIILAIVLSFWLVCAYGILQTKLGFERVALPGITEQQKMEMFVGKWNIIEGGARKVYSTFQNGNIFGNHLALFIPFLGGIYLGTRKFWKRMLLLGLFLLAWYALILTYSRGALVGTVSGMLALGVIAKKIRLKAIIAIFLATLFFFAFLYYYADRPELVRYDFRRMATDPERFSAGRFERAKEAIRGFYRLPLIAKLFGVGFGGKLISPKGWVFQYVDNLYLTLLFKMGMVGLIILLWLLSYIFSTLFRSRTRCSLQTKALIDGGIAGLVAALIHNLADTLWFFPPLSANFWFLAGITMMIGVIGAQETEENMQAVELQKTSTAKNNA